MALTYRFERKLGWLLACLLSAGVACEDDTAADAASTEGEHDDHEHGDTAGSGASDEHEHEHEHGSAIGPATNADCPEDSTLTYDNFGKQFMEDYCLRCHGEDVTGDDRNDAPDDHNFTDIVDIRVLAEHIDQYAGSGPDATNETMPPSDPKPATEEREKLSEWLACGAPE